VPPLFNGSRTNPPRRGGLSESDFGFKDSVPVDKSEMSPPNVDISKWRQSTGRVHPGAKGFTATGDLVAPDDGTFSKGPSTGGRANRGVVKTRNRIASVASRTATRKGATKATKGAAGESACYIFN